MALEPGVTSSTHSNYQDDVYERIMKKQRIRKIRFYTLVWTVSILAVIAGFYFGSTLS